MFICICIYISSLCLCLQLFDDNRSVYCSLGCPDAALLSQLSSAFSFCQSGIKSNIYRPGVKEDKKWDSTSQCKAMRQLNEATWMSPIYNTAAMKWCLLMHMKYVRYLRIGAHKRICIHTPVLPCPDRTSQAALLENIRPAKISTVSSLHSKEENNRCPQHHHHANTYTHSYYIN